MEVNQFVCLHASTDGEKMVNPHEACLPQAIFGAPALHVEGTSLRFDMQANETVLLRLDSE